jgi:HAD superfamily hydrolase (TIGR01509 family)
MQDQEIDRARQVRRTPCPLPQDVDLVIFDCDGVLVDSESICCAVLSEQLAKVGVNMSSDEVVRAFLGRDFSAVDQHVRRVTGAELPRGFREEYLSRTLAAFSELRAIRGVAEAIDRLTVPACVASSSDRGRVLNALQQTGLMARLAERVWTIENVERGKPAPDLFLAAAASMGIPAARALVIEDSVNGVLAAKAAGMRVWGFVGGAHYRGFVPPLLEAGAEFLLEEMSLLWPVVS